MERANEMSEPVCIIAEVGSVHDGSFGNAGRLIDLAAEVGANTVKFQTHISAAETLRNAPAPAYFKGEPRYEYFERTGFDRDQWVELRARCQGAGVEFLSSPFSIEAVALLEEIGLERYKIPSGEVTNLPLLEEVARTGKPVLLSSGMSSWAELDAAVECIRKHNEALVVMQCTSAYPCPHDRVGLNVLEEMKRRYGLPVGLSDHTLDNYASFAAVALGAQVIERHLTFSRRMYGSDAPHSLEPDDFAELARGVRAIEDMLASPIDKSDVAPYGAMKQVFEKSLVCLAELPAGTVLTRAHLGIKKPGTGIPARELPEVVGRRLLRGVGPDTLLAREDIDWKS
jgi:N,N'-diacetyllegionaminate synthase